MSGEIITDRKLLYYMNFKSLVHLLARPFPILLAVCITFYSLILFFLQKNYTGPGATSLALNLFSLWVGSVTAVLVFDSAQKQYLTVSLAKKPSYVWPILTPILWMLVTIPLWFITLPVYFMYKKYRA